METITLYRDHIGDILGLYRDKGKENGNNYIIWGCVGVILDGRRDPRSKGVWQMRW